MNGLRPAGAGPLH